MRIFILYLFYKLFKLFPYLAWLMSYLQSCIHSKYTSVRHYLWLYSGLYGKCTPKCIGIFYKLCMPYLFYKFYCKIYRILSHTFLRTVCSHTVYTDIRPCPALLFITYVHICRLTNYQILCSIKYRIFI